MIRLYGTLKILGLLLMLFSLSMIPPLLISFATHNQDTPAFLTGFLSTLLTGLLFWLPFIKKKFELKNRDGFLIVTLFWILFCIYGAIPFYTYFFPKLPLVDAVFESTSGLTTTGATIFSNVEGLPPALLYYRQQLHFLGGLGVILLAVAVLPMLGIGGLQLLYQAETGGRKEKLRPRIAQTAKTLWYIYLGLVVLCALSYWIAGMNFGDAIEESFSTVSTGGFSVHNQSFGYYDSQIIDIIAMIFMLLGSTNFELHYQFIQQRRLDVYFQDPEFKFYLKILFFSSFLVSIILLIYHWYKPEQTFINSFFTVISVSSTTGLLTTPFNNWPSFLPILIMLLTLIGGCTSSTAGGIKILRLLLFKNQVNEEFKHLIHPQGIFSMKLGNQTISDSIIKSAWAFGGAFLLIFILSFLLLLASGLDSLTSFSALAACISNSGSGLGKVAVDFSEINSISKWILILTMLMGRLEIFTILVLLSPYYWKR